MPPGSIGPELERIGRLLVGWRAQVKFVFWTLMALGCLWVSGMFDIYVQFERPGRIFFWLLLVAVIGVAFWRTGKVLAQTYTIQAVASIVESYFPQLDNHLINFLQFSSNPGTDPFKKAYVSRGLPEWNNIDVTRMRNKRALKWSLIGIGTAVVLLVAPCITVQQKAWVVSLWRIVNPFSNVQPVSMTNILGVDPGNATVLQGSPVLLSCNVKGKNGHFVSLDIKPADSSKSTYLIGQISDGKTNYPYRVAKATTDIEYRFRAGDSPSPKWFKIKTRPPLALAKVTLKVQPPQYIHLPASTFDAMGEPPKIMQGSEVEVTAKCNTSASSITLNSAGNEALILQKGADDKVWTGKFNVKSGNMLKLVAVNTYNETVETMVPFELVPDNPPIVQILQPKGRMALGPTGVPAIEFSVVDDYGITDVALERVSANAKSNEPARAVMKNWDQVNEKAFVQEWKDPTLQPTRTDALAFRVVAKDAFGHLARSQTVIFDDGSSVRDQLKSKNEDVKNQVASALGKIIDLQKSNLATTQKYQETIALVKPEQWVEVQEKQRTIRQLSRDVINNPLRPLGSMTASFQELYEKEMIEVISSLGRIANPKETEENRKTSVERSVSIEEKILRILLYTQASADKALRSKSISGLIAMLDALINGQTKIQISTKKGSIPGKSLAEQQDSLASDASEFAKICQVESVNLEGKDKNFSAALVVVVEEFEKLKIKPDMVKIAEKLDSSELPSAVPMQDGVIKNLTSLKAILNSGGLAEAKADIQQMADEVHLVKEKLERLKDLEQKVLDMMKAMEAQKDMSAEERDKMEEDIEALKKNIKESMLQVPTDLQIFKEMNVANEIVEDVYQAFEELRKPPPTDEAQKKGAEKVGETHKLKDESILEAMKKASGRMDEMEMWLDQNPGEENVKRTAEAFDKNEMTFMALGAMATEDKDIVGDLVKQSQEMAKKADDGAINHGTPDVPPSNKIAEGEMASFAAQGKSGNQAPDHKEQDGRSNVGRQGMSDGETAAGGGTVGKGDKNLEERMTVEPLQSGQVQLDGEVDTKATGGGKLASGAADSFGMARNDVDRRMDSTAQGTMDGMKMLMQKAAGTAIKASLMNLRTDELAAAAHHIRQADDQLAKGNIGEVNELLKKSAVALKQGRNDLTAGVGGNVDSGITGSKLEDVVDGGIDQAPKAYEHQVSDYYKAISESK